MTKEDFNEFLSSEKQTYHFALWMLGNQTEDEISLGQTIVWNGVGFNKPDSYLSYVLICIREWNEAGIKVKFPTKDLSMFHRDHLLPRLQKYYEQWCEYMKEVSA